jgi:hypothetical protein
MCSVHEQQKLGRGRLQKLGRGRLQKLLLFNYTALCYVLLYLPRCQDQWRAVVIAVMNIRVV